MDTRKVLIAVAAAVVLLVSAGVAYAANNASESTIGSDDGEDTYKGTVSAPDQSGTSLQDAAKIDQAAAEQAALKAVPGTVHEAELESSDNGYVVYDIEIAGDDGNNHEVKVDAGNGEVLHQDLEDEADESDAGETDDAEGPGDTEDSD
ncbi:MAG: PepSY domain-containing protein [Chloroflexota bacterium]|nr:PepSY domain-containing protein [Actinomycetota bacterium]MDQ5827220.1 PepSY domain-containing protein [Chloroflexota bacterium]